MPGTYKALILCGGESSRIKYNKALLYKDSLPLFVWWTKLFTLMGIQNFISCRENQVSEFPNVQHILDSGKSEGPLSGILSAFDYDKSCSWIIVACDLVYMEEKHINQLLLADSEEYAFIAFKNIDQDLPYSLCTIYKPAIYHTLLEEFTHGKKSPLHTLQKSAGKIIQPDSHTILRSINTPDDLSAWQAGLHL